MSTIHDPYGAAESETSSGRVFTVTGQDWDSVVQGIADSSDVDDAHEDHVVVNMGPQHPSTHGVLRLILELEGETVTEARCGIGYLHTGIEKNMEYRSWVQGVTFCTRMDYLSPFYNEATYCLGVERLLDIEDDIPEKAQVMRVLLMELNRISSHLVCIATGGMEIGALTVMTIGFRERETYDFFGIIFDGHPALTRIEMPDDWPGHPQRKDYPLGGIPVEYKGATIPPPDTRRSYS